MEWSASHIDGVDLTIRMWKPGEYLRKRELDEGTAGGYNHLRTRGMIIR